MNIYVYIYMCIYIFICKYMCMYIYIYTYICIFIWKRWFPRGGFIWTIGWPNPTNWILLGWFLDGWFRILPSKKLFCHVFEKSCSAMAKEQLEEKVQQLDQDAEESKTGCRSLWRAHDKVYEQVPALICHSNARRILCAAAIWEHAQQI